MSGKLPVALENFLWFNESNSNSNTIIHYIGIRLHILIKLTRCNWILLFLLSVEHVMDALAKIDFDFFQQQNGMRMKLIPTTIIHLFSFANFTFINCYCTCMRVNYANVINMHTIKWSDRKRKWLFVFFLFVFNSRWHYEHADNLLHLGLK